MPMLPPQSGGARTAICILVSAEAAVEAALADSKRGTYVAFVQRGMNQPEGVGVPISEARHALQVTEDELEAAKEAKGWLQSQIPDAEKQLQKCGERVDAAVNGVIVAEIGPHAQCIREHYSDLIRQVVELDVGCGGSVCARSSGPTRTACREATRSMLGTRSCRCSNATTEVQRPGRQQSRRCVSMQTRSCQQCRA